ncbi:MAG: tryptophan synthase alpha chain [Gemmatales bacterium]|nr:MAG: tryptophan synthase alpha chain [Gemmatales bacterium]
MNAIDARFDDLRRRGRKAFIPFVTAGDPDSDATKQFVASLVDHGADLIEVGFPYSDPIADGAVIQASYARALSHGLRIDDVFACISHLAELPNVQANRIPLIGMVSYTLVYRRGIASFVEQAQKSGLSGAIVPDLPVEESDELCRQARKRDFKIIQLVTPTTPRERARRIAQASSGFLYCVSVTGITGARATLPTELVEQLAWLRQQTDLPLCVGFGISKPEHAEQLRSIADGIIVGSAIVRLIEQAATCPVEQVAQAIGSFARSLADALNPAVDSPAG